MKAVLYSHMHKAVNGKDSILFQVKETVKLYLIFSSVFVWDHLFTRNRNPLKLAKEKWGLHLKDLTLPEYFVDPKEIELIWISKEAGKGTGEKISNLPLFWSHVFSISDSLLSVHLLYSFSCRSAPSVSAHKKPYWFWITPRVMYNWVRF